MEIISHLDLGRYSTDTIDAIANEFLCRMAKLQRPLKDYSYLKLFVTRCVTSSKVSKSQMVNLEENPESVNISQEDL